MSNYSCILIGSRLSSIGAQTLNLLSFLYHGKEKGSLLPCVWSVVDHRGRQNVETTSVTHSIMHLSSASPRGGPRAGVASTKGDPKLMWGNTWTLRGLCIKFLPLWWGEMWNFWMPYSREECGGFASVQQLKMKVFQEFFRHKRIEWPSNCRR